MRRGDSTFVGARLTQARLAKGMRKNELAEKIGVSQTSIKNYEDGTNFPETPRLDRISLALDFPHHFFQKPVLEGGVEQVFWRSRVDSKLAREMTEQRMMFIAELVALLEDELDFPRFSVPTFNSTQDFQLILDDQIEVAAEAFRNSWGLANEPIPDMILLAENAGVPVATFKIPSDKQDGFCFFSPALKRSFIGINVNRISAVRARFDVAHELGHILLHHRVQKRDLGNLSKHKIAEHQANYFASALLFPRAAFIREVRSVSLDYFSALKRRWGVSIGAMIMRAYSLGMIGDAEKKSLFMEMNRRRWRGVLAEPYDNEMSVEKPRMLPRAIEAVLSHGLYSVTALRSAAALPPREIEELLGLKSGYLASVHADKQEAAFGLHDLESGVVTPLKL